MKYYQFEFESISGDQKDMLIAMLNDIGFTGFEEEANTLKAFIDADQFNQNEFENVISTKSINYSKSTIEEINWNEKWESGFEPVTIFYPGTDKAFVYLRAGFHPAGPGSNLDIVITPKMSFGTGHHATTYLMMEQMSQLDFAGKKVIDFGTGTGVLAILAEKLGAENIIAIDNDDWSINNARENIAVNNCEKITLTKAETIVNVEKSGIILANINLNIIVNSLQAIKNASESGGKILFSGIMKHDQPLIVAALEEKSIHIDTILERNGWLALLTTV